MPTKNSTLCNCALNLQDVQTGTSQTNAIGQTFDFLNPTGSIVSFVPAEVHLTIHENITPECIMENEKDGKHYTTVKWNDGTYTTVKACESDAAERSVYMAFCAALAKKIYGSNAAVHRVVNRHTEDYLIAKKREEEKEKRAKEQERIQAAHERKMLALAKQLRLKEEAKAYNRAHRLDD